MVLDGLATFHLENKKRERCLIKNQGRFNIMYDLYKFSCKLDGI